MKRIVVALVIGSLFLSASVASAKKHKTLEEKRQDILAMKDKVLADLYSQKPDLKAQLEKAPGYAVFSDINVNVLFASVGHGYGVVHNLGTDKYTYMRMAEVGGGLGAGVKDFRVVFVFHTEESMNRFVNFGWGVGAQGDAAVKAGDKGKAVASEVTLDEISVYQLTETGIALQATIKGTKYWKSRKLNEE